MQHGRNLGICPHQQSRPNDQFKTEWLLKFPLCSGNFELPHVIRLTLMKGMERLWAGLLMISGSRSGCHILKKLFFFCYRFVWFVARLKRPHLPGRPLRINLMSRYICFSQNGRFDVSFEELFQKLKTLWDLPEKNFF